MKKEKKLNFFHLRSNQMYYTLCLSYHFNTEAVLFAFFRQAGPPQRVDC